MERQYAVAMRGHDVIWVQSYLRDVEPRINEATHWWVWEWESKDGGYGVEVTPGTSTGRFSNEGFILYDDPSYYEVIGYLVAEGFPTEDY